MENLGDVRQALEAAAPEAAACLVELLGAKNERTRLLAAKDILDRTLGQSTERVVYQHAEGIDAAIEELIEQLEQP